MNFGPRDVMGAWAGGRDPPRTGPSGWVGPSPIQHTLAKPVLKERKREILTFSLAVDFSGFGSRCFGGICPFVIHSWHSACGTEVTKSQALLFLIEAGTGGLRCTLRPRAVGTVLLPLVCHGDLGKGDPEPGWEGSAEEDHVPWVLCVPRASPDQVSLPSTSPWILDPLLSWPQAAARPGGRSHLCSQPGGHWPSGSEAL